jgi:hypothetical protein
VETSARVPLISMRPFLLRSGRPGLCRKSPPVSQATCPVILKLLQCLTAPLPLSPYGQHTKKEILGLQKPSVPNIVGRQTNV